jgi:hypothetical protein
MRSPIPSLRNASAEAKYRQYNHDIRKTTFGKLRYCYECDKALPRIVRGGYQCRYSGLLS